MKLEKIFRISWKRILLLIVIWFVAVILHNAVYAVFGVEDAIFFIIAIFVLPIYAIVSIIYTLVMKIRGWKK